MANIQERKSRDGITSFRVQVRVKGNATQTATFERKTDAKRWAVETEAAIREGRHFKTTEARRHTIGGLIDRYIRDILPSKKKSERKQTAQLLWWKQQIGTCLLSDVTPALIAEQRDKLSRGKTKSGKERSPSTVVRYLAALSHAYTIAVKEWGWVDDSPMRRVSKPREPRGRIRFLSDDERTRLLKTCKLSTNPYLYIVVVVALSTGMRQAEIMNLRWEHINLKTGKITLHETKNREIRVVPLQGLALTLFKDLVTTQKRDIGLVFPSEKTSKPIDLRAQWEKAIKDAQVTNFRFHDLRHSAASYLAMNGATIAEIAEVLGHKTLAMVKRYAHLSESHTTGVVADMNEQIFG